MLNLWQVGSALTWKIRRNWVGQSGLTREPIPCDVLKAAILNGTLRHVPDTVAFQDLDG